MTAFQGINHCRLVLEVTVEDVEHRAEMTLRLIALTVVDRDGGPLPSVLLSVTRKVAPTQTLAAAILQLLYALDFQLAENEFSGKNNG